MDFNSTSFAVKITEILTSVADDPVLKKHQSIVVEYIKTYRGLLVQHDLGTGKSLIAAAIIADQCALHKKVIFISARTLHDNMEKTINKYVELKGIHKPTDYKFITMNASNMLDQFHEKDKIIDKYAEVLKLNLNDKILIIDEAHNLFNSITNGSKNATGLYSAIMRSNVKVIFLSGTPINNHPFELVPCFNMIAGKALLPTDWNDFNMFFVDMKNKSIKNKVKFQNRIVGLTSYFGSLYDESTKKDFFPKLLPIKVHKIPMSQYQFQVYAYARELELMESLGMAESKNLQKPQGVFSSSYKRLSRQASNIAFPKHAIITNGKRISLISDKVTNEDLLDKNYSPKWHQMVKNIGEFKGKQLVYSSFVENAGVNMFARLLDESGWILFESTEPVVGNFVAKKLKKYIIISGETEVEDRYKLIDAFNDDNNINGEQITLILISSAGAEGIDLKAIRHIHIMEPYWNWARIEQVIGRGNRWKSHIQLPEKEWTVEVHMYLSDYPKDMKTDHKLLKTEKTTEILLYENAILMHEINGTFYKAIAEAAIDCAVHNRAKKITCRLCTPTDERLYDPDIFKDMKLRSPCKPMAKVEVTVKKIMVDNVEYAWYKDDAGNIIILEQKPELGGFIEMNRSNPLYPLIYEKISG